MYVCEAAGYVKVPNILLDYYKSIVGMFTCLFFIMTDKHTPKYTKLYDLNDRYSYCIYLTHHIFILGALSVMSLTQYLVCNIAIALILTFAAGVALFHISGSLTNLVVKRED